MHNPETWRELLGQIIKEPLEKQRLATALKVNTVTLSRWVSGDAKPRQHNLHMLIKSIPTHREQFMTLVAKEFPGFVSMEQGDSQPEQEISSIFYSRVLRANSNLPPVLHFWSLCDIILRQAVEQFDPNRIGVAVIVAQCMPPSHGQPVRSLRELVGRGTPPWNRELQAKATFLGAESLAGYAVATGRPQHEQNLTIKQSLRPFQQTQWEQSAAVYPIMHKERTAGTLIISSTQTDYFSPARLKLGQDFADLLVLAFKPEEFYDLECIKPEIMPSEDVQRSYLAQFQQRVTAVMIRASRQQQPISSIEAEQLVWQEMEEELLQLAYSALQEAK
ncbi:MAG: GAF domain-containing protein [Ktedonobacteraceae bacterium]|nr:GAF domain-containing protein [Ktedonobacteraceae bacterium]MBV9021246.1 GAF domain-containing protein [Ktedonobacteraceae bacterium]